MNEVQFVRVKVSFAGSKVDTSCYERPILEHTSNGWELVQIFVENPAAVPLEYVLIFRRPRAD
jgi:hypothetical protein